MKDVTIDNSKNVSALNHHSAYRVVQDSAFFSICSVLLIHFM